MVTGHSAKKRNTRGRTWNTRRATGERQADGSAQLSGKVLKSFLFTLALGIGLLLLASLAVYFLPNPSPVIRPLGIAIAALTALGGGFLSGRIHGQNPTLCGLCNGTLLLALLLLLSLFFRSLTAGYSLWLAAALHTMIPLLSILGAILGTHQKPKPKKHKRRR